MNIELQIPVIYRADFGLRGFTPLSPEMLSLALFKDIYKYQFSYFIVSTLIVNSIQFTQHLKQNYCKTLIKAIN